MNNFDLWQIVFFLISGNWFEHSLLRSWRIIEMKFSKNNVNDKEESVQYKIQIENWNTYWRDENVLYLTDEKLKESYIAYIRNLKVWE